MKLKKEKVEEILFALLRMALHGEVVTDIVWKDVLEEEWKQCYKLAAEHGVMALAWDGLQYIVEDCIMSKTLKLSWALAVQNYEERYEVFCQVADELSKFYASHEIGMIQLKGVGFSAYYPIPSHREGGDIDIYTYSNNHDVRSDEEANDMADALMRKQNIAVDLDNTSKHSNFVYKGISIENHKLFLEADLSAIAMPMNGLLKKLLKPGKTNLCEGKYQVNTPNPEFNALFLAFHAAQHFGLGIKLHHLFDWACLIKKEGWCVPEQVTDKKLLGFMYALTKLSNDLLGTNVGCKSCGQMDKVVYEQMMHPLFSEKIPVKGKVAILRYKAKRLRYIYNMYNYVFDVAWLRWIFRSVKQNIRKPQTIFR